MRFLSSFIPYPSIPSLPIFSTRFLLQGIRFERDRKKHRRRNVLKLPHRLFLILSSPKKIFSLFSFPTISLTHPLFTFFLSFDFGLGVFPPSHVGGCGYAIHLSVLRKLEAFETPTSRIYVWFVTRVSRHVYARRCYG